VRSKLFTTIRSASGELPPQPLNPAWVERCYRTGDLVRLAGRRALARLHRPQGHQIKHMGYRIELEEIEARSTGVDTVARSAW